MWGETCYNGEHRQHLIVLDFEGFSYSHRGKEKDTSPVKSTTDSKLFALCVLLSSSIFFNIEKTFDEKTMKDLDVIQKFENYIKIRMPSLANTALRPGGGGGTPGGDEGRGTIEEDNTYSAHLLP